MKLVEETTEKSSVKGTTTDGAIAFKETDAEEVEITETDAGEVEITGKAEAGAATIDAGTKSIA